MSTRDCGLLVAGQVSELWWSLILLELQAAQKQLRADDLTEASRTLRRVVAHFEPLNATWRSIAAMTPKGLPAMLSEVSAKPGEDAFRGVYEDVLAYFSRLGLAVPTHLFGRDPGIPHVPNHEVEQIWRDIYEDPYPDASLQQLGDTLAEIAGAFTDWKYRHLMATRRRSAAIESLAHATDELPYSDLWAARGLVGSVPPTCPTST